MGWQNSSKIMGRGQPPVPCTKMLNRTIEISEVRLYVHSAIRQGFTGLWSGFPLFLFYAS